jgi:hypothetical protein
VEIPPDSLPEVVTSLLSELDNEHACSDKVNTMEWRRKPSHKVLLNPQDLLAQQVVRGAQESMIMQVRLLTHSQYGIGTSQRKCDMRDGAEQTRIMMGRARCQINCT